MPEAVSVDLGMTTNHYSPEDFARSAGSSACELQKTFNFSGEITEALLAKST